MTMTGWQWLLGGLGATLAVYAALLVGLALAGRRGDARALASFIPDCLLLLHVLLRDPRVPRGRKLLLAALLGYLTMPVRPRPGFHPDRRTAGRRDRHRARRALRAALGRP
jgi:hypothetical protein